MTDRTHIGFESDGTPVPAVDFDYEGLDHPEQGSCDTASIRAETVNRLLAVLISGATTPEQVGRRALTLAYIVKHEEAPALTVRGLAELFGVSGPRAHQLLTDLRQKLQCLHGD